VATTLRWGVLSTSKFFLTKVLPALANCRTARLDAIGTAQLDKARTLGIPKVFDSYAGVLADPAVDAVYIPLPNHLHVEWAAAAARAGKHVLCEKPIALTVAEAEQLATVQRECGVQIGEAFMVATHPQWLQVREWVREGKIGQLRAIQGFFSYTNLDPRNIRNQVETGGGALMDIGCYPIFTSRFVSEREPERVLGLVERDPVFGTDRLTSALLDFGGLQASFTCSTQLFPYQKMHFYGTEGHIEVEIPFNAPPDRPSRIFLNGVASELPIVDQYTVEFDAFSEAVLAGSPVPVPVAGAVANMRAIEGIFRSAAEGGWIAL
jgi:predicted dehydrogenase